MVNCEDVHRKKLHLNQRTSRPKTSIEIVFLQHNRFRKGLRSLRARKQRPRDERARVAMGPEPLPLKRDRALTLPLPASGGTRQVTDGQLESLFFKLPLEIRELIYEYVFCAGNPGCVVRLETRHNRLGHLCERMGGWGYKWQEWACPNSVWPTCKNRTGDGFLVLLRTCRGV
jgi:hypothetical protein